jgi:hypothetical protein
MHPNRNKKKGCLSEEVAQPSGGCPINQIHAFPAIKTEQWPGIREQKTNEQDRLLSISFRGYLP